MTLRRLEEFTKTNIIRDKTGVEGGYVDNVKDRGGETNHGITIGLAKQYRQGLIQQFGWNGQMRDLSLEMAYWLYDMAFWRPLNLDAVIQRHPLIADKMFDLGINAGGGVPVRHLQTILNIMNREQRLWGDLIVDGGMGPATLGALDAYIKHRGLEGIFRLLVLQLSLQGDHYVTCCLTREQNEEFAFGWAGRVARDIAIYAEVLGFTEHYMR